MPGSINNRIERYYKGLWQISRGIDERDILRDLPESIQNDIFFSLYKDLVENVEIFPKKNKPLLTAILRKLR